MATDKGTKPQICLRDLSNYNEDSMPTSPVDTKPSSLSPGVHVPPNMSRPLSAGGTISASSPHALAPSPLEAGVGQQLPPACGARQLSKLKRFLTTLQQFGSDISPEIGERVRTLVLGLVNSHLSIEEFHSKLQEATNFPLRPFVIPFLKANLPLLQRELFQCARLAKQSPQQFLAHNQHILFDVPTHRALTPTTPMAPGAGDPELNENGKRSSPDRTKENGVDVDGLQQLAKRPATLASPRISPGSVHQGALCGPLRLEDISVSRELRERERAERMEQERLYNNYNYHRTEHGYLDRTEDDWKHVDSMLHCIVGMVDKCKRTLSALRERGQHDREELALWTRHYSSMVDTAGGPAGGGGGGEGGKKRAADIVGATLRQTEERVADVKRRAEEAVNEVKRQAVAELQKAVIAAETKAGELVATERGKMERAMAEARQQAHSEALSASQQDDSNESCWNCGRKASETCSGCNVARYCGSFCQHKDWESHHRVCGQARPPTSRQSRPPPPTPQPAPPTLEAAACPSPPAPATPQSPPAASPSPPATSPAASQ